MERAAVLIVLIAACGDDVRNHPIDAPPDLPVDTLPGPAARGTIVEWTSPTAHGAAVAGARVCLRGAAHCVTSDANGAFALDGLPSSGGYAITVDAAGHMRTLVPLAPTSEDVAGVTIAITADAIAQQRVTGAAGTYPLLDKGLIEATTTPPTAGATIALTPAATAVYLGADGFAQSGLTATSAEGGALFVGLAAADYTVKSSTEGLDCPVAVEAATLTRVTAKCSFLPF